jgi:hypothetical protein
MKLLIALAVLVSAAAPATAQQAVCGYGQVCPNVNPVPFPVINPMQGLSNLLTNAQRQKQPQPAPNMGYAPIATPPPVMPPGH